MYFPCFERGEREFKMSVYRCRYGDGFNSFIFEQVLKFVRYHDARVTALAKR